MKLTPNTKKLIQKFHLEINEVKVNLPSGSPEWKNVRRLFFDLVNSLRRDISGDELPIDLEPYLKLRKIHRIKNTNGDNSVECLLPTSNGFIIFLPEYFSKVKKRFTIAHEIAHTFFYDTESIPPKKILRTSDIYKKETGWEKEEWLCTEFAHELLVPSDIFISKINNSKFKFVPESIINLSREFNVSTEFIVRKGMVNLKLWSGHCIFMVGTDFDEKKISVHKGKDFPKNITIYGKRGIITSNNEIKKAISDKISDGNFNEHRLAVPINGKILEINFCVYSSNPRRILGICNRKKPSVGQQKLSDVAFLS